MSAGDLLLHSFIIHGAALFSLMQIDGELTPSLLRFVRSLPLPVSPVVQIVIEPKDRAIVDFTGNTSDHFSVSYRQCSSDAAQPLQFQYGGVLHYTASVGGCIHVSNMYGYCRVRREIICNGQRVVGGLSERPGQSRVLLRDVTAEFDLEAFEIWVNTKWLLRLTFVILRFKTRNQISGSMDAPSGSIIPLRRGKRAAIFMRTRICWNQEAHGLRTKVSCYNLGLKERKCFGTIMLIGVMVKVRTACGGLGLLTGVTIAEPSWNLRLKRNVLRPSIKRPYSETVPSLWKFAEVHKNPPWVESVDRTG